MSATVDSRILTLKFDSSNFERGAARTISGLQKLKEILKLPGARKGFDDISKGANSVKLDGLGNQAQGISAKFSAMGAIAFGVLNNIASRAVDTGLALAKSFTVQPLMDGMREYESKMGSIQTILANTSHAGTNLSQVNKALDELNTYADKTVYSFADMTDAIGKFTAAGLSLGDSSTAIKGIANLGAVSGSTGVQVKTAMLQLSQALASGKVGLQDWNSVVNAGMGGKVFQDALVRTADVMHKGASQAVKDAGSFRASIEAKPGKEGWLTGDVLSKTLQQLSGDLTDAQLKAEGFSKAQIDAIRKTGKMAEAAATEVKTGTQLIDTMKEASGSGWATTWQMIIGDFNEAKQLWTGVNNVLGTAINNQADARNKMFADWKKVGGRTDLLKGLSSAFQGLMSVINPIKDAFRDIFPPMTGARLAEITHSFAELMSKMKLGSAASANLRSTFRGLFAVVDIVRMGIVGLVKGFAVLFGGANKAGGGILEFTGNLGDFLVRLRDTIKSGDLFTKAFEGIANVIRSLGSGFKEFAKSIGAFDALKAVGKWLSSLNVDLSSVASIFSRIGQAAGVLGRGLGRLGELAKGGIKDLFDLLGNIDMNHILGALATGSIVVAVKQFKSMTDAVKGFFDGGLQDKVKGPGIFDTIKESLNAVTDSLSAMQNALKATTLLQIAAAMLMLAIAMGKLAEIDPADLAKSLSAMTVMFAQLFGAMKLFVGLLTPKSMANLFALTGSMILLAGAVVILTTAVKTLSSLSWGELIKGLVGVTVLMAGLAGSAKLMEGSTKGMLKAGLGLIAFALAIKILVSAVKDIAGLDVGSLTKGLIGIGILMAELALFMRVAKFESVGIRSALGIVALAAALKIMASAVSDFAALSVGGLAKGLSSISLILAALAGFTRVVNPASMVSMGVGMIALGVAMKIFASAVTSLAALSLGELAKGLGGMAAALLIVAGALALMPSNMLLTGAGFIAVSTGVTILAGALTILSSLSLTEIGRGLLALGGSLAILSAALILMSGSLAGSAALLVAAGALAVLTPQIIMLSQLDLAGVGIALLAMAGAFAVLGAAGLLLGPVLPVLLGLGGALLLMGAGLALAGAGVAVFAAGLQALVPIMIAGFTALWTAITTTVAFLPTLVATIGIVFVQILTIVITNASLIAAAVVAIGTAILTAITALGPALIQTVVTLVTALLTAIQTLAPQFAATVVVIGTSVLMAVRALAPLLISTITTIISSLLSAIRSLVPQFISTGVSIILGFLAGIRIVVPQVISTIIQLVLSMLSQIAAHAGEFVTAATDLIVNFLNGIARNIGRVTEAGANVVISMMDGIQQQAPRLADKGVETVGVLIRAILGAITGSAGQILGAAAGVGRNICSGMVQGIQNGIGAVTSAAQGIASRALSAAKAALGVHSPSREFMKIGAFSSEGLAAGLNNNSNLAENAASNMAGRVLDSVRYALANAATLTDENFSPTLTPVIDLTEAQKGAKEIGGLLSDPKFSAKASVDLARNTSNDITKTKTGVETAKEQQEFTKVEFTQNNYSPKALSTVEIYRRTRNQIGAAKEVSKQ